jgi:ATP-dependent DNA helicase HFM1/MER3
MKSPEQGELSVPERPTSNMSRRRAENTVSTGKTPATSDEFGDAEIDDDELMKVSFHDLDFDHIDNYANPTDNITRKNTARNCPSKDKFRAKPTVHRSEDGEWEPRQLDNGKWACNHACKDKQACKHMCCKDGMDKPPKKTGVKRVPSDEVRSQSAAQGFEEKEKKKQTRLQLTASKRKSSVTIERLDLTQQEKRKKPDYAVDGPRDYRDLHKLHKSIQNKDPPSSISTSMYQKPAYCYGTGGHASLSFLDINSDSRRPSSISSDYGDIQLEDLKQPDHIHARATASSGPSDGALQFTGNLPLDHVISDRLSDTFGDDESLFGDAMVGIADSEELRAATQDTDGNMQENEDSLNTDYGSGLMDNDFVDNSPTIPAINQSPVLPLKLPTSSSVNVASIPPEKGRSLFLNETSSPYPADSRQEPARPTLKRLLSSESGEAENTLTLSRRRLQDLGSYHKPKIGTHVQPILCQQGEESIKLEEQSAPEAYKDLEPWLFKEFGDIVELVD